MPTPRARRPTWPAAWNGISATALVAAANTRAAVAAGRADVVPTFLSDVPALVASGDPPLDVALVRVCPPDEHGFCSLGLSVVITKAAVEHAHIIVAQVNARVPRALGGSFIHLAQIALRAFWVAVRLYRRQPWLQSRPTCKA